MALKCSLGYKRFHILYCCQAIAKCLNQRFITNFALSNREDEGKAGAGTQRTGNLNGAIVQLYDFFGDG